MQISDIYGNHDPYKDFVGLPLDLQGWNSDAPIFSQLIHHIRPQLIIEVGTWKAASAVHMAECCKALDLPTKIVTVDSWLGSLEMIAAHDDPERDLMFRNGYPTVFYQFLSNVIHTNHQDRIIPFPQTSLIAAAWFRKQNIKAQMIYIDASHTYEDVLADIKAYWPILEQGGAILGDDADSFVEVLWAVQEFCRINKLAYIVPDGRKWVIRK